MRFLVLIAMMALAVESRSIGCYYGKIILRLTGVCSLHPADQKTCIDICDGTEITGLERCAEMPECCWDGERCSLKLIPTQAYDEVEEETADVASADDNQELASRKRLSRRKRESDPKWYHVTSDSSGGMRASSDLNRRENRYGDVATSSYYKSNQDGSSSSGSASLHLPSGKAQIRGQFTKPTENGILSLGGEVNPSGPTAIGDYTRENPGGSSLSVGGSFHLPSRQAEVHGRFTKPFGDGKLSLGGRADPSGMTASANYIIEKDDDTRISTGGSFHLPSGNWQVTGGLSRPALGGRLSAEIGHGSRSGTLFGLRWTRQWG